MPGFFWRLRRLRQRPCFCLRFLSHFSPSIWRLGWVKWCDFNLRWQVYCCITPAVRRRCYSRTVPICILRKELPC